MKNNHTGNITVREYRSNDSSRVQEIYVSGIERCKTEKTIENYDLIIEEALKSDLADIQKSYIDVDGGNFWVAEDNSFACPKVVGIIAILPRPEKDDYVMESNKESAINRRVFELLRFAVDKDYEGTGVAQLLITQLEKFAFEKQHAGKVIVASAAKRAIRFYEKQDYERINIKYYKNDLEVHYFEKLNSSI